MQHQCAYMKYYALESIAGDVQNGKHALDQIQQKYPHYYDTIMNNDTEAELASDPDENRYSSVASLFEAGQYSEASAQYYSIREDSTISATIRGKSCFNHAWLNDYYLFDKTSAVESYSYMVNHFPEDPLAKTARNRLNALTQDPSQQKESSKDEESEDKPEKGSEQDGQGRQDDRDQQDDRKSNRPKEGEDEK